MGAHGQRNTYRPHRASGNGGVRVGCDRVEPLYKSAPHVGCGEHQQGRKVVGPAVGHMEKQPSWRTDKRTSSERGYGWRWQKARKAYLALHPLCVMCLALEPERITAANVVDHIIPHEGNKVLFWDSENNWQPLCKPHHDVEKAEAEGRHTVGAKFDANGRVVW